MYMGLDQKYHMNSPMKVHWHQPMRWTQCKTLTKFKRNGLYKAKIWSFLKFTYHIVFVWTWVSTCQSNCLSIVSVPMHEIRVCEMDSGACAMMSLSLVCLIEGGPQMVLYPNRRIYVSEKYISGLFGSENILNPSLIVCLNMISATMLFRSGVLQIRM